MSDLHPESPPAEEVVDVASEPVEHEEEAAVAARGQAHAEIQADIEAKAHEPAEVVEPEEHADPNVDYVVRKAESAPHEAAEVRAGEARISRVLLAEIDQRRAVDDIETLVAACASLLDELGE